MVLEELKRLKSLVEQFAPGEKASIKIIDATFVAVERAKATDWPALVAAEIRRISGVVVADIATTDPAQASSLLSAAEVAASTVEKIAQVLKAEKPIAR